MNPMLVRLRDRYLALSRRERMLALFAAVATIGGLGEVVLIEPALHQRAALMRAITSDNEARELLVQRIAAMQQPDPNTTLRAQYATLQQQLASTDREFESLQHGLVQPEHMGALLQSLLSEQRGLQLLGLRSLPVTAISDLPASTGNAKKNGGAAASNVATAASAAASAATATAAAAPGEDTGWLYRHAVEIRVQGSYADMLAYLQALEALPRQVHWGELEIDARNYPANVMTVTIFTVSLEKTWWVL